ncbi:hypothetical protein F5148DRAFT_1147558 [Russula earlei]|uniref:Uncharacterized protein n=1 Tax=Russula earlei TaxID=71964 RepID=A0ACC0UFV5_9AGAM|nr:hypothetical protein F5148DRAFT_1147558 [Russula earlei]
MEVSFLPVNLGSDNQNILFIPDAHRAFLFYLGSVYTLPGIVDGEEDLPENLKGGYLWLLFDIPNASSPVPPVPRLRTLNITLLGARIGLHFTPPCRFGEEGVRDFCLFSLGNINLFLRLELDNEFEDFKTRLKKYLKSWRATSPSAYPTDTDPIRFHFSYIRSLHGENPPKLNKAIDDILKNAVTYFGYVARDIFRAVLYNFEDVHNHVIAALDESPKILDKVLRGAVHRNKLLTNRFSQRPIVIKSRRKVGLDVEWKIDFRTVWVGRVVMLKFRDYKEARVRDLISYLKSVPQGATLAAWLFEAYAHRTIVAGVNCQPMRKMTFLSSPSPKPCAPNFPLIDAFIVSHDDNPNTMHLWVLQMTTSKKHRGSRKGYAKIGEIIDTLCLQVNETNADRQATLRVTDKPSSGSPGSSPQRKKRKLNVAASSSAKELATVEVHYVLVCPQDPDSDEMTEWRLPKGWNDTSGGNGYLLEIPLEYMINALAEPMIDD